MADVEPGIKAALAHDGPVLVDAVVNRQGLAVPPKISSEMATCFTLYMLKAVMSGRGDEVLDLARTNLWRDGRLSFDWGRVAAVGACARRAHLRATGTLQ